MSVRDIVWAAREHIMIGMQVEMSKISDAVVLERAKDEFRRVEKFLGFEPGSWGFFI
jgi:hypothetical protein